MKKWTTNVLYKQVKNELQMCYINKWRMNYKCVMKNERTVLYKSEEWTTNVLYNQVKNELQMCYINKWRMNYKCVI